MSNSFTATSPVTFEKSLLGTKSFQWRPYGMTRLPCCLFHLPRETAEWRVIMWWKQPGILILLRIPFSPGLLCGSIIGSLLLSKSADAQVSSIRRHSVCLWPVVILSRPWDFPRLLITSNIMDCCVSACYTVLLRKKWLPSIEEVCMLAGQMWFWQIFTSEQLVVSLNAEPMDMEGEQYSINQLSDILTTEKTCPRTQRLRREGPSIR